MPQAITATLLPTTCTPPVATPGSQRETLLDAGDVAVVGVVAAVGGVVAAGAVVGAGGAVGVGVRVKNGRYGFIVAI